MQDENLNLTKQEAQYSFMICRLAAEAVAGTELAVKLDTICRRLGAELQKPEGMAAALGPEEKNLLATAFMLYELLVREKYEVLKEHFHLESIHLAREQVMQEVLRVSQYAEENRLNTGALQKRLRYRKKIPARKLYIADLHFYHDSLNHRMDRRGFAGFEEMNAYMIRQWNDHVTKKDEVYILGDFAISRGRAANEALRQLNGKKYLIEGNHDKFLDDKEFDLSLFEWIRPYAEIQDTRRKVILCHYPVFCYNGQYRKSNGIPFVYMLYGHVHDTHDERLVTRFIQQTREEKVLSAHADEPEPIPCQMINCFCMFSDYIPLTLDDWIQVDKERRERHGTT